VVEVQKGETTTLFIFLLLHGDYGAWSTDWEQNILCAKGDFEKKKKKKKK